MSRSFNPLALLLLAPFACEAFDARSTSPGVDQGPKTTPDTAAAAPAGVPTDAVADEFAAGASRVFATNPRALSLSSFDTSAPDAAPKVSNFRLKTGRRMLQVSPREDFAFLLYPDTSTLAAACPGSPEPQEAHLDHGADSVAMLHTADGLLAITYTQGATSPSSDTQVSMFSLSSSCELSAAVLDAEPQAELDALGTGPQRVFISNSGHEAFLTNGARVVAIRQNEGKLRISTSYGEPLTDPQLASSAENDFLVGRSGDGLVVLEATEGVAHSLDAGSAGAGGAGGASAAVEDETLLGAGIVALPGGHGLLVSTAHSLLRYELPGDWSPVARGTRPGTELSLGSQADCAVVFSPGEQLVWKVKLDDLSATPMPVERPIKSVNLFCRPDPSGGAASCCTGKALVAHESEPLSPLAESEAYTIVDLTDSSTSVQTSSLPVKGIAAFDSENAVLVALGHGASPKQVRIFTPFVPDGIEKPAIFEVPDEPSSVAADATGALGYVGFIRRDGSIAFARRLPNTDVRPTSYQLVWGSDFRLAERVTPLTVGSAGGQGGEGGTP